MIRPDYFESIKREQKNQTDTCVKKMSVVLNLRLWKLMEQ